MKINEVAKVSGVSSRTLHYYDEIGLLKPTKLENGYRVYTANDLDKLQQILSYKFLGFKLSKIAEILNNKSNHLEILEEQRQLILKEKSRYEQILNTIENTIKSHKGEGNMSIEEKFSGFKLEDIKKYEQSVKEKYGKEVIEEAKERQKGKEDIVNEKFNSVFRELAECKKLGLEHFDEKVQNQVDRLYDYFRKYGFDCTIEVFSYIGKGYSADLEFKNNIDKFGEEVAEYISEAIEYYVNRHK